jgi:hypothetical protein
MPNQPAVADPPVGQAAPVTVLDAGDDIPPTPVNDDN